MIMTKVLALVRLAFLILGLLMALVFVLAAFALPFRNVGTKLSERSLIFLGHYFFWVCNIDYSCQNPELIERHQGLLFANHTTYADIPALIGTVPARFVTAIEVRQRPILGWVAAGIGCIFIDRADKSRGRAVSTQIADAIQANPYPPVIIYPEGKLGPGDRLLNFQRGGFRIAATHGIPYLLCAIRYSHPEIFTWYGGSGESMTAAVWRMVQCTDPLSVELVPLEVVHPSADDNPVHLAKSANQKIAAALDFTTD